jgi:hypothetical protein
LGRREKEVTVELGAPVIREVTVEIRASIIMVFTWYLMMDSKGFNLVLVVEVGCFLVFF